MSGCFILLSEDVIENHARPGMAKMNVSACAGRPHGCPPSGSGCSRGWVRWNPRLRSSVISLELWDACRTGGDSCCILEVVLSCFGYDLDLLGLRMVTDKKSTLSSRGERLTGKADFLHPERDTNPPLLPKPPPNGGIALSAFLIATKIGIVQ